jgi:hypothetical protein
MKRAFPTVPKDYMPLYAMRCCVTVARALELGSAGNFQPCKHDDERLSKL